MKKEYISPTAQVVVIETQGILCTSSIVGIDGTADLETTILTEETEEYLAPFFDL